MTTEQIKAKYLVNYFYKCMPFKDTKLTSCEENPKLIIEMEKLAAKQCSIIAVEEILKEANGDGFSWCINVYWLNDKYVPTREWKQFWMNVKEEIIKL